MLKIRSAKGWTISLELAGARDGREERYVLSRHADKGEALFGALEQLDALVEGCRELQELLEPGWLPKVPGSPSLRRTPEGVEVKCGRGVLARASGGRRYAHTVAYAALESAHARLVAWRAEAQARYDETV